MLVVGAVIGLLTPVRVYPDSISYMASAKSLFSASFASDYFWVREPLYPAFLRVMLELPPAVTLHLVPLVQGVALAGGLWLFSLAAQRLGVLGRAEVATYYALTCLLVIGYAGAVLQQTWMILAAGALALCAARLATAPVERRILVGTALTCALATLLSSIFLAAVVLLPVAAWCAKGRRFDWRPFAAAWGSGAVAIGGWMVVRVANGQALGLGAEDALDPAAGADWPTRLQALLATFGLGPDFYGGVDFNVLSYSNVALGLAPYFGGSACVQEDLVDLVTMPDAYLVCGSTLAPSLPPALLEPLTTFALLQLVVGVIALVWAWGATTHLRTYAVVLAMTMLPCLPVAYFLADGNSRYGLPVLAMSLVLTVGMAERALALRRHARADPAAAER